MATHISVLDLRALTSAEIRALRAGPKVVASQARIVQAIVHQPVHTTARPLLLSTTTLRAGSELGIGAGRLGTSEHLVTVILSGPGFYGERRVLSHLGVVAVGMRLPRTVASGQWAVAVEDLSAVHAAGGHRLQGSVLLDIAILTV